MQLIDPKQALAMSYYKDPSSDTFANLKQSMIKAGYKEHYADSISGYKPKWLTENMQADVEMIKTAERNLKHYNNLEPSNLKNKSDVEKAKVQVDVSKFIVKTLARKKYGEQEEEDKSKNVQVNIINYSDKKVEAHEVEVKEV